MKKKFFITTPTYYVNAKPHIGHAYTTIAADVLAQFHRLQGEDLFLLMGTDEHGAKIQKAAERAGKNPQEFVDGIAGEFKGLWEKLGIRYDGFSRTTDEKHKEAVKKTLQVLYEQGVIYRGFYEGLYCVGCEQFKSDNELVDGKCPDHNLVPENMREECYLLKMEEKQDELIGKIESGEFKIAPEKYKKEILSFLKSQKLKDVSISRKNVSWGIPLPFDSEHTTYVWFDAFLYYLTGVGWDGKIPLNPPLEKGETNFWPPDVQLIGKDILRVHATIWPIMLMHLGIPLPKMLFVHGHILSGGKKMSKTLGNVIGIDEMIDKFGVDGTRYLLTSAGTFGEDVDVTKERLTEKYNADLANGLGNLVSRVVKLMEDEGNQGNAGNFGNQKDFFEKLELSKALEEIWKIVREDNKFVEDNKPWELVKGRGNQDDLGDKGKFGEVMGKLVADLLLISELLVPFMPETSEKIKKALEGKGTETLFPRLGKSG